MRPPKWNIAEREHGSLYGKTGSGTGGNAWFVGFVEQRDNRIYFAVYLEDMQNKDIVSGNVPSHITGCQFNAMH